MAVDWSSVTGLGECRQGALIVRTWAGPCPVCGGQLTGLRADAMHSGLSGSSGSNAQAGFRSDSTASGLSLTAICTALINPAPDPLCDEFHVADYVFTAEPCGHRTGQKIRLFRQALPAPGTLGALIADWAALEDTP